MIETILLNLPWVDLIGSIVTGDAPDTPAGQLYWLAQAVTGFHLIAKSLVKLSEVTPWTWDDGPAKALAGWLTTALELVGKLFPGVGNSTR